MGFAERILECPMEVIEGVPETLVYLAARHELTLFTKGHPEEQTLKIDRSGLGVHFEHAAIVREKDADAYRSLVTERGMEPVRAWMIGNSPKSDVNPALEAGLNAVFVPHAHTWVLEKQEIRRRRAGCWCSTGSATSASTSDARRRTRPLRARLGGKQIPGGHRCPPRRP